MNIDGIDIDPYFIMSVTPADTEEFVTKAFKKKAKMWHPDRATQQERANPEIMNKIRASILVMGPLLARFGTASVAMPGGDLIGMRPINYHLEGFKKLGVEVQLQPPFVFARMSTRVLPQHTRIVLDYPSVGATENIMMLACLCKTETTIVNAALEPEVFDLINILSCPHKLIHRSAAVSCYTVNDSLRKGT